ncbi:MAG: lactate racemase domain-containing protein [Christensenellales bacterium]
MPESPHVIAQSLYAPGEAGLSREEIRLALERAFRPPRGELRRVLLIPPDYTRFHSNAGLITQLLYQMLAPASKVDILPALGTHLPVSETEWRSMYGSIPYDRMIVHNWRSQVVRIGEVPADFVRRVSEGLMDQAIPIEINRHLLDKGYDLILSIGQVVPHEVVGMANHAKNILVGCGGARMINASHMLGAFYGLERIMGKDHSPVRALFDYAAEHFLAELPLHYILTVTDAPQGSIRTHGLFIGRERSLFEAAVRLSQEKNITRLDKPLQKVIVLLDEEEFKSTWLGNKAVYRTRMAIQDGGELIVLAPGVDKFGEDPAVDALIRKYGYRGRDYVLETLREAADLRENLSAAAHLIHGSSDGRFSITYCTRHLAKDEVEGIGYRYLPLEEALRRYPVQTLKPGMNALACGETVYYVPNPALGLWMTEDRLN